MWTQVTLQELGQFKERCQEKAEITADPNNATLSSECFDIFPHMI